MDGVVGVLLSILVILTFATRAAAQATPIVPPDARVYRDLERLAAVGLIDSLFIGIRPVSEREIVRLLGEARSRLDRKPAARAWAERVIAAGLARYERATQRALDEATLEGLAMNASARTVPSDITGEIDANVNPLVANRGGRPYADGGTLRLETSHSATLGKYVAATIAPRAMLRAADSGSSRADLRLQRAAVSVVFDELAVELGRDQVIFGQSPAGGVMLSTNAPPLDMVRVWNERGWRVPLLSRLFGPIRGVLVVADLGQDRLIYPHTKLIGYHVAGMPHPQFEISFEVLDAMGGTGGQPATFLQRVTDVVPVIDAFNTGSDLQFSNKLAGMDVRWRMPRWAGMETYVEVAADDVDGRNVGRSFTTDGAYIGGVSFNCFIECGRYGVRAEYHQTGIRYYMHSNYPLTKAGFILGDQLGPRGVGGYVSLDADLLRLGSIEVSGAFEVRGGNTYRVATTGPNDEGFHFELVDRRPSEKRSRAMARWCSSGRGALSVELGAGIERVENFNFTSATATNVMARGALVVRPR